MTRSRRFGVVMIALGALAACGGEGGSSGGDDGSSGVPAPAAPTPPSSWANVYDAAAANLDWFFSAQETAGGGYIAAGGTSSSTAMGIENAWLVKLNSAGAIEWQKAYGDGGLVRAKSVLQKANGEYVWGGETLRTGGSCFDGVLMKVNSSGNIVWQKRYSYGDNRQGVQLDTVLETPEGGYIAVGNIHVPGVWPQSRFLNMRLWIAKLGADGSVTWQKRLKTDVVAAALGRKSVQITPDGGYVVATSVGGDVTDADAWVLKFDGNGNILWQKTYGGGFLDWADGIQPTSDGGYVLTGSTYSFGVGAGSNQGYLNAWVLKLDGNGNVAWQNAYGLAGRWAGGGRVAKTADGGCVIGGTSLGASDTLPWVFKIDSGGALVWQRTYDLTAGQKQQSGFLRSTADEGFLFAGYGTTTHTTGDAFVVKLKPDGTVPPLGNGTAATVTPTNTVGVSPSVVSEVTPTVSPAAFISSDTNATVTPKAP